MMLLLMAMMLGGLVTKMSMHCIHEGGDADFHEGGDADFRDAGCDIICFGDAVDVIGVDSLHCDSAG